MASNPKFCSICDQRHITKPPSSWCSECNQALCTECKDFHTIIKASQFHSTVAISNYLALDSSFPQVEGHCSVHDDRRTVLLCLTCLEEHMKCEDVVRISKLTKDVKTSEHFVDTQKSLSDIILNLNKIQSHLEDNVHDIKKQKESVLQEITQIREKIDSHLYQIENVLKTEVCKLVDDQCNTNIGKTLEEIQNEKTKIEKFQQQMNDLNKYGSDFQAFIGMREISPKTETTYKNLPTLGDNDSLDMVIISCKIDRMISGFIKEVKSLGSIQVQKIPSKINLAIKRQTGTISRCEKSSINVIKLKVEHTFKLSHSVTGCCFLPGGKLVLCDRSRHNFVKIVHPHGELMFEISMSPNFPFDVTCIDDENVAVSSDNNRQTHINIINKDTKSRRSLHSEDKCYEITHKDGSLVVCVEGKGI